MAVATVRINNTRRVVKLGRRPPKRIDDKGTHLEVENHNGETRLVAKIGNHYSILEGGWKPPTTTDWWSKGSAALREMLGNDREGDCVVASILHRIGVWYGNEYGTEVVSNASEALTQYHHICGGGDNGCVITDVLEYHVSHGLAVAGSPHKADAYVAIDWTNRELVQTVIAVFGPINVGVNLPEAWTCTDCEWGPTQSRIVGGHDVSFIDYDDKGVFLSTWGGKVHLTWEAATSRKWIEEAYVTLTPDWYARGQRTPAGFNLAALQRDIDMLRHGQLPTDPPEPNPPGPEPTPPDQGSDWKGAGQLTLFGLPAHFSFRASTDPYPPPKEKMEDSIGHPVWRKILKDALAILLAATTMNIDALAGAIKQLLTDLGYQPDSRPQ